MGAVHSIEEGQDPTSEIIVGRSGAVEAGPTIVVDPADGRIPYQPAAAARRKQLLVDTFYLRDDDGSALPTKDMHGRATIQDAGKTITVTLEPAAPNRLVGKLQAPLGAKARVVFSANVRVGSHTHTLTARYLTQ